MAPEARIDEVEAARMLRSGERVRDVAHRFGVSTQAVYLAIKEGRLPARAHGGPRGDATPVDGTEAEPACAGSSPNPG